MERAENSKGSRRSPLVAPRDPDEWYRKAKGTLYIAREIPARKNVPINFH
jgi:hypothetical protein